MNRFLASKLVLLPAACVLASATSAIAMSIKNADPEARIIIITEEGERFEREIQPNETITVCEAGCFITFPNGALTAYEGAEEIVIRNGGPVLPF